MFVFDLTPPAVPSSSPVQRLKFEPLMAHMLPPSALTVVVPLTRSLDRDLILRYGFGTGPPGLGVLQTSGRVFTAWPLLPLWTSVLFSPLTLTVTGMASVPRAP